MSWLSEAIVEEELELEVAIHPRRGRARDGILAAAAVLVVVGASLAMEQAAATLGARHAVPEIVVGGLFSPGDEPSRTRSRPCISPRRGRGAATLSTAMNSNALNVAAGLLVPGAIVGLGAVSGPATLVAVWYFGLTAFALGCAYAGRGLRRWRRRADHVAYLAFAGMVLYQPLPVARRHAAERHAAVVAAAIRSRQG